jgi:transcriptional regulator with XRE-family HTH domain
VHQNAQSQGDLVSFDTQCGERLRKERERLGFTQQEFAERIGVRREMWSKYERGQAMPGGETLAAFAAVGGDVLYVLCGEAALAATASDEKELLLGYRKLDIRGKAGMLGMVQGMNAPEETAKAIFHGDVGQVVQGDQTAPVSFNVGGKKNKNRNKE